MANTGDWLGLYEGDWLGNAGATDPNSMYGSSSFRITVSGSLVNGAITGINLKYWDGSSWQVKTLKYWDGESWVAKTLKYWDGATWI